MWSFISFISCSIVISTILALHISFITSLNHPIGQSFITLISEKVATLWERTELWQLRIILEVIVYINVSLMSPGAVIPKEDEQYIILADRQCLSAGLRIYCLHIDFQDRLGHVISSMINRIGSAETSPPP